MKNQIPHIKLQRSKDLCHLIHRTWFKHLDWPTSFIENYFSNLTSALRERGIETGIKENKALRLKYTQWLANPHIYSFPPLLLKLGAREDRSVSSIKLSLTVLNVTRALRVPPVPSLGSIEDPLGEINLDKFRDFLKVAIKPWMKKAMKTEWDQFHYSTKSGPNGQAMYTSFEDLRLLPETLRNLLVVFGGQKMKDMLFKILTKDDSIGMTPFDLISAKYKPKKSKGAIRRVAFISDREGKTRTIGVLDYWSQTVLKPLHDSLMGILRKLKADMTFRQEANLLGKTGPFYSVDLKAATDSFPISLQVAVLNELIGPEKTSAWKAMMVDYPFLCPHRETPLYYRRGQPMGAYSSWAVFSLTHHLLIQFCASEVRKYPFTQYQVLGDDVVINDPEVGETYLHYLDQFQIPVSIEKTMISQEVYEFAKRWFLNGVEVSPFPINGLFEEAKYYFTFANLMITMDRKGYCFFEDGNPNREFVMQVWDIFGKKSQKDRLIKKFQIFLGLRSNQPEDLHNKLNLIYPKDKKVEDVVEIQRKAKLYTSMHDLLCLQEFYNSELNALKQGHVVEKYKSQTSTEDGQATPAYEYADVWPPLNVARRLVRQYMRLIDAILKDHKEECQLGDEAFQTALLTTEVPSFMISRQVINERTARKKLGAKARLTGTVMSLWNEFPVQNMNIKYLEQAFGVVIELDFDEWDECMGRVVLEPMTVREERLLNLKYLKAQKSKNLP